MADRLAENGAVKAGQESTATVGTVSRLAGAGQIEAEIRRLVAEGFYTAKVAAYTVKGRLINAALDAISIFSPLSLFSNSEQGVWYDPSDMDTLYQDRRGVTPVYAVEQPVGLMLDKSQGLEFGPELVVNGDFSTSDLSYWDASGATNQAPQQFEIIDGVLTVQGGVSDYGTFYSDQVIDVSEISWLKLTFSITRTARVDLRVGPTKGGTQILSSVNLSDGEKIYFINTSSFNTLYFGFAVSSTATATFDNFSLKELISSGNHAFQATSAARPVLSARYNLLSTTETLSTQNVTTVATDYTLYFTGTGSITLSGTATGSYNAGTHTITTTAGTLTLTVSGDVFTADLRVSNDGVDLPAYQRVDDTGTTGNYDTVGFPLYLRFDGVDDSLATNSIDFTATDKVTLWSGVRKQQDVNLGIFTELSSAISNTGTFNVTAPGVSGTTIKFQFSSRGINVANPSTTSALYSAPISVVFTGIGDISGDSAILRLNGDEVAVNTSDQGESNYGNYPLYIGARNGTSFRFAGNCYSLIIRGAESTETEITDTETWVNEKTKAWS